MYIFVWSINKYTEIMNIYVNFIERKKEKCVNNLLNHTGYQNHTLPKKWSRSVFDNICLYTKQCHEDTFLVSKLCMCLFGQYCCTINNWVPHPYQPILTLNQTEDYFSLRDFLSCDLSFFIYNSQIKIKCI